ncbi:MAG: tRNA (adenosine(37)-N6)-threonylcarbamoyltransferase complex ATPase subunit type 1 TsaE [Alphaproteobacteria bacterium]
MEYISNSEAETSQIAQSIASKAKKGDTFLLYGTLGVGKSVFSRAFIKSLCGEETEVPSPTFTLLQTYESNSFEIFHFDLYRIEEDSELFELRIEDALYGGVCLIEWPTKLGRYMPKKYKKIEISQKDNVRIINITEILN